MTRQINIAPQDIAQLLGDPHPLLDQLGSAEDLAAPVVAATSRLRRIDSVPTLRSFLRSYGDEILMPVELPAILRAHHHTVHHEVRELIALDRQQASQPALKHFAAASCRVGQRQLNRLRPLRDHRLVRRYLAALEQGEARGWHTLVYGVSLGVFSLPLRQGLIGYAHHTLGGFIENAAGPLALTVTQCREVHAEAGAKVSSVVQTLLASNGKGQLRLA